MKLFDYNINSLSFSGKELSIYFGTILSEDDIEDFLNEFVHYEYNYHLHGFSGCTELLVCIDLDTFKDLISLL